MVQIIVKKKFVFKLILAFLFYHKFVRNFCTRTLRQLKTYREPFKIFKYFKIVTNPFNVGSNTWRKVKLYYIGSF